MKIKSVLFIVFVMLFFCNCNFSTSKKVVEETEYLPNIAWTLQTDAYAYHFQIQKNEYIYFEEYDEEKGVFFSKVDMSTGTYVWTSDTYPLGIIYSPYISDDYLCLFNIEGNLYIFDNETGKKKAQIHVGSNELDISSNKLSGNNLIIHKNYLYWSNYSNNDNSKKGLVRINLNDIDFSKPDEYQIIIPECVWESPDGSMTNSFIIENDIMYFLTVNSMYYEDSGFSYLIAWDLSNEKEIWCTKIKDIYGDYYNSVKLIDSRIFVFDVGILVYDKNTGKEIYKKIQTREDLMHEINLCPSVFTRDIFYKDGKFYYTRNAYLDSNESMGFPEEYNKNIICYDANKYKIAWADIPPYKEGTSLQTRPVVVNGKCFVVTNTGLRVYDEKNGNLIGVWHDLYNTGCDTNASYEDKFIFFNHDRETGKGILTAINVE